MLQIEEVRKLLREKTTQGILKDILSLHYKGNIDPTPTNLLDRLLSGIKWHIMTGKNGTGLSRYVYAFDSQKTTCKITGLGNVGNHSTLHNFIKPTVIRQIIQVL